MLRNTADAGFGFGGDAGLVCGLHKRLPKSRQTFPGRCVANLARSRFWRHRVRCHDDPARGNSALGDRKPVQIIANGMCRFMCLISALSPVTSTICVRMAAETRAITAFRRGIAAKIILYTRSQDFLCNRLQKFATRISSRIMLTGLRGLFCVCMLVAPVKMRVIRACDFGRKP